MGSQSIIFPFRRVAAVVWLALAFLSARDAIGQAVSALTVPLLLPSAVVFDAQGNLYIAETGNHVIRRIDPSGNITAVAGTGVQGFSGEGGAAVSAQLDSPEGLALDGAGDLYIADTHNHRIRKVAAATRIITTVAGTGAAGFSGDNGAATAAQLDLPTALALDAGGDLYLADSANHRIRRIDAVTGSITTVAGTGMQGYSGDNGPATAAVIDSPTGLAVDAAGNLYLADTHNQRIRRVDAVTGAISTIAGNGVLGFTADGAPGTPLALPQGLSLDAIGNLYFADRANHRIRRIDANTGRSAPLRAAAYKDSRVTVARLLPQASTALAPPVSPPAAWSRLPIQGISASASYKLLQLRAQSSAPLAASARARPTSLRSRRPRSSLMEVVQSQPALRPPL